MSVKKPAKKRAAPKTTARKPRSRAQAAADLAAPLPPRQPTLSQRLKGWLASFADILG